MNIIKGSIGKYSLPVQESYYTKEELQDLQSLGYIGYHKSEKLGYMGTFYYVILDKWDALKIEVQYNLIVREYLPVVKFPDGGIVIVHLGE